MQISNLNSEIFDKGIAHGLAATGKYIAAASGRRIERGKGRTAVAKLFNSVYNGYAALPS